MAVLGKRDIEDPLKKVEHELNDIMWSLLLLYKFYELDPDESFVRSMQELEKRVIKMKQEAK